MPLDADPLSEGELATLRGWIAAGAALPAAASPDRRRRRHRRALGLRQAGAAAAAGGVARGLGRARRSIASSWPGWRSEGLTPSPEADRATLLRRVTLDLIGLPPTLDGGRRLRRTTPRPAPTSELVDRLLASPHYGERWARPWLDLARYADTNGYEKDRRRDDLAVPRLGHRRPQRRHAVRPLHRRADRRRHAARTRPTAQRIATGFHRNTMTNEEGGIDPDEVASRRSSIASTRPRTVWLGMTLGCAQCHNHKYDPFSQKDYYRLFAFFANPAYDTDVAGDGTRYTEAKLDLATPGAGGAARPRRRPR